MREVGHFRELRHGRPDGPSLVDAVGQGRYLDRGQIADYLMTASVLAVTGSMVDDVINPEKKRVAPLEVATDGEWIWPRDLSYYVREYGVALPTEFVDHIRRARWTSPQLSHEQLAELTDRLWEEIHGESPEL
ncbi:hypothetical protein [Sphaerisporangium perillae]|uniref:hypothetical protein n=1 Tax=Sphaerisporangium perillae TaxID=2935860 RepID=UPI00200C4DAF|nr:hypothetical protein [Sphaerisporangium perillae]